MAADGRGLVGHAGAVLLRACADRTGFDRRSFRSNAAREAGTAPGQLLPFAVVLGGFSLMFLVGDRRGAAWRVYVFVPSEMVVVEFP